MRIGVAYYPEHWPEERWPVDAELIRQTGIDVVRLAEFAWSRLEPKRLSYQTDWLHRAIDVLAEQDLKVILCTPTATPPSWLFMRHPSMLPDDRQGLPWYRGSRRHVCVNNRPYRRYVRRIVREMAKEFGRRPEVVAWQLDNELGCHESGRCYCDDCEHAFREWLKRRYGMIDRLNKLWGTVFWSQSFNDWHEIPAPRRTPAQPHPSLVLDYKRFTSATFRDFVAEQREVIGQYGDSGKPITTNSIGLHLDQIDQFSFGVPQDVAAVDNYPVDGADVDGTALALDLTRSVKPGPFWVLEQQAGATMIPARRGQPRPGQLRLWSFQSAARGAELVSYFRWRTCAFGQEMHWYGMLDADGTARRRYDELKAAIGEMKAGAHLWEGRGVDARAAVVLDYAAHWALEADRMCADLSYLPQLRSFHALLRRMGLGADLVPPDRDPTGYALVVVPMPVIGRVQDAERWQRFVEEGGTLLVTAPAGYRSDHNAWLQGPPPGPLGELLGVQVVEHDMLGGGVRNAVVLDGQELPARSLCSVLELAEAEAVGTYASEYYAGGPALTRRALGEGAAWFLGTVGTDELYGPLLEKVAEEAGLERHPWSSERVELIPLRTGEDEPPLAFVLNHDAEPIELPLPEGAPRTDLLAGVEHTGSVRLEGYGLALLQG